MYVIEVVPTAHFIQCGLVGSAEVGMSRQSPSLPRHSINGIQSRRRLWIPHIITATVTIVTVTVTATVTVTVTVTMLIRC